MGTHVERGAIIHDVRYVFTIVPRNGLECMLYVCPNKLYLGALDRVHEVTPIAEPPVPGVVGTPWQLPEGTLPTCAHVVTDAGEWLVLSNRTSPTLWRLWLGGMDRFEEAYIERKDINMLLLSAKYMAVYGERLIFGDLFFPDGEMPHAVGWYGINGPFDTTFPTAGENPLTDTPGPVTGFSQIMDYLVIGKPNSITMAQKTYDPNFPFAFMTRVSGCGWTNDRTVARIAGGNAIVFLATDHTVRVFDGNTAEPIDTAIRNVILSYKNEHDTCWAHYDAEYELYMLIFSDKIMSWNFREKWWTEERRPEGLICSSPVTVAIAPMTIDELEGTIDDLQGIIDDLPGAEILQKSTLISTTGSLVRDPTAERESYATTAEYRFPKPQTITRLVIRVRVLHGGELFARHSLDGGGTWSPYICTARSDIDGVTKVFYDFVATSEQFTFGIYFKGRECIIEDMIVDIPVSKEQEQVTPLNADTANIV